MRQFACIIFAVAAQLSESALAQYTQAWSSAFQPARSNYSNFGLGGTAYALAEFAPAGRDSQTPELYIGGDISFSDDNAFTRYILVRRNEHWQPVGTGLNGPVHCMLVWDCDGPGPQPPALYVGGDFDFSDGRWSGRLPVAKWDGTAWTPVGSPLVGNYSSGAVVRAMAVYDDDGDGPNPPTLYITGTFATESYYQRPLNNVAKLVNGVWQRLSTGLCLDGGTYCDQAKGYALAVFDDDAGGSHTPALYVGGQFNAAGGVEAFNIAKWDGTNWSPVHKGIVGWNYYDPPVQAMTVFDDDGPGPDQPALYVGGNFLYAGNAPANGIAKWDGLQWSSLQEGIGGTGGPTSDQPGTVKAFTTSDDHDGISPKLIVAGSFTYTRTDGHSTPAKSAAKWDGHNWITIDKLGIFCDDFTTPAPCTGYDAGVNAIVASREQDSSGQSVLYLAGSFNRSGLTGSQTIARWKDRDWAPFENGLDNSATSFACLQAESAPNYLYAAGGFTYAGALYSPYMARWNGHNWSRIDTQSADGIGALCAWDRDGPGPLPKTIYAAGFNKLDCLEGDRLVSVTSFNGIVHSLQPFTNAADRPVLVAGGQFTLDNPPAIALAQWDGAAWTTLGQRFEPFDPYSGPSVGSMTVFDPDGPGPLPSELYVSGFFTIPGPQRIHNLAKWDGLRWSGLGIGNDYSGVDVTFATFDDGNGPALYVGGVLLTAGGVQCNGLGKWNGREWSAIPGWLGGFVSSLAVFDDDGPGPNPPALYIAGDINQPPPLYWTRLIKWDGHNWSNAELGQIDGDDIFAMTVFQNDPIQPPSLFLGGGIAHAGPYQSTGIACLTPRCSTARPAAKIRTPGRQ